MRKYITAHPAHLVAYFAVSILANIALALFFTMYAGIADAAMLGDFDAWRGIAATGVALTLFMFVAFTATELISLDLTKRAGHSLRCDCMKKALRLGYGDFHGRDSAYYTSIILNAAEMTETEYFTPFAGILGEVAQLLVMAAFVVWLDARFLAVALAFSIPVLTVPRLLKRKLGRAGREVSQRSERYTATTTEYVGNAETIKLFGRTALFGRRFSTEVVALEQSRRKLNQWMALNHALIVLAVYLLKVGTVLFAVGEAIDGVLTVAAATAIFGYSNQIGNPLRCITDFWSQMNESAGVRGKVTAFLAGGDETDGEGGTFSFEQSIVFRDFSFTYPGAAQRAVGDVNIRVEKGKKYLLVGRSGSGKSTLFRALMGYFDDYDGEIWVDDRELRSVKKGSIADHVAFIDQNAFILSGTVRENVTLGKAFDDRDVIDALTKAGMGAFLRENEGFLDTPVQPGGQNFSVGECQRLCLARALVSGKELILADEVTSSLDEPNALRIERILLDLPQTVVFISHRITDNVQAYDQVIEIGGGRGGCADEA